MRDEQCRKHGRARSVPAAKVSFAIAAVMTGAEGPCWRSPHRCIDAPGTTPFWIAALSGQGTAQVKARAGDVG